MGPGTPYKVQWRSLQAPVEPPVNTQDSETKKANRKWLAYMNWWERFESNRSHHLDNSENLVVKSRGVRNVSPE
jgi:hypothetical protein